MKAFASYATWPTAPHATIYLIYNVLNNILFNANTFQEEKKGHE